MEDLFQPFRQLGTERTRHGEGHGLGLAIVRAIADAHGAALTARARPAGGLDIEVTFPSTSAAQRANAPDVTAQLTNVPNLKHTDLVRIGLDLPWPPTPGNHQATGRDIRGCWGARLSGARQAGTCRQHGSSVAVRGKATVPPTVLAARTPSAIRPWTPQHRAYSATR